MANGPQRYGPPLVVDVWPIDRDYDLALGMAGIDIGKHLGCQCKLEWVDAIGLNAHQKIICTHLRLGHDLQAYRPVLLVFSDDESRSDRSRAAARIVVATSSGVSPAAIDTSSVTSQAIIRMPAGVGKAILHGAFLVTAALAVETSLVPPD